MLPGTDGRERIDTTLRLGRINLILHGLDADVRLGNSLLNDLHSDQRLQIGGRRGQITDSNANYVWMMHFLYHLADGGTAGYDFLPAPGTFNAGQSRG